MDVQVVSAIIVIVLTVIETLWICLQASYTGMWGDYMLILLVHP